MTCVHNSILEVMHVLKGALTHTYLQRPCLTITVIGLSTIVRSFVTMYVMHTWMVKASHIVAELVRLCKHNYRLTTHSDSLHTPVTHQAQN